MESENKENEIPEMNLDNKYSNNKNLIPESSEKVKKEFEKTKKEIEKLKAFIVKKYPFTQSISILPPASIKHFIEEEEVPKETEKYIHLYIVIPEENFKEYPKIKEEIVKQIEEMKQKIWIQIKTPADIWELCLDSKFELAGAIAMSYPLHDTGILGALRVAEIHKSLVLQKFEKYVVSYVVAGSLVRGEAIPTSDVDVFIIINDTDVKRMPRLELKERLRAIIYQYVAEASSIAGVQNKLSPQVYLLTDFWESVKDAHPVIFTFIRDGIPLYDRGTFMPWKSLLRMGKLKPSPEAIDMFMSMGDKTVKRVKTALLDVVVNEIFWGVTTPSQALLMLYGLPPPTPKHVASEMKRIFVDKEKMLEKRYVNIIEKVINIYKDFEHEKIKEISGEEVDKLLKDTEDYLKRLKELREQIEQRTQEKTIEQIYQDVFALLKNMFGNQSQEKIISEFESQLVKKAKFAPQHLRILKDIVNARTEFKKGKSNAHKVDEARKNASILINDIIEYNQRCDLISKKKEEKK
ncbi:Uncharacterised protein [uncultured archaeon]|nr:Uncharacterised protein [uncultured archaeon]